MKGGQLPKSPEDEKSIISRAQFHAQPLHAELKQQICNGSGYAQHMESFFRTGKFEAESCKVPMNTDSRVAAFCMKMRDFLRETLCQPEAQRKESYGVSPIVPLNPGHWSEDCHQSCGLQYK